ncbi:hypothetical protein SAMN05192545_3913 [Maribacter dokdonensis]|uniref:Uncharacterized protein n=1 Tax=Maribacter dokdonensis TaxID=320912 RepID=A0ABY0V0I0_9FLAO|nr:hypothetical protein [Maribacter dokdonensis]SDT46894.1 hypothetical protein SAMN05192545_3913 [Maribacter dokdonensis]
MKKNTFRIDKRGDNPLRLRYIYRFGVENYQALPRHEKRVYNCGKYRTEEEAINARDNFFQHLSEGGYPRDAQKIALGLDPDEN